MNETSPELNIATKINELHSQAESIAKSAKEQANKAVEIASDCGRLLTQQKKSLGHGNWLPWVKSNLNFSEDTAGRYMTLHRRMLDIETKKSDEGSNSAHVRNLEQIRAKTLRQAYIATGILPDTPKADSGTKFEESVVHIKHIDALVLWYRKTTEAKAAKYWKPIARESLFNDLAPLMEIYNELVDLQESMSQ